MYFQYGDKEIEYLKSKDKKLAEVIDKVGHIDRTVDTDLFSSVVHHIIGQQISTKAQQTIWLRMNEKYGHVTPEVIDSADAAVNSAWKQYGICLIKRLLRRCHLSKALVYGLPK